MNAKLCSAVTTAFIDASVRVYCPETPMGMFSDLAKLQFHLVDSGVQSHQLEVVLIYSDYTFQLAQNLNRSITPTLFVFSSNYPVPNEIKGAAKKLDLKECFSERELEKLYNFCEE